MFPALTEGLRQRLLEIADEICDVLNSYRKADQRIVDAERGALVGAHRCVRHDAGVIDQALDAPQALRDREDFTAFERSARGFDSAADEEADNATETVLHLRACQGGLRMTRQARIQNALHLLMLLQPARDFHRVLAALAHAQRQRLESPQREKAVKRNTDTIDRGV